MRGVVLMRWMLGGALLGLSGCAGMIHTEFVTGACAEEQDRCVADRCSMVKDSRECVESCEFEGRVCERRQGAKGFFSERLGDEQALLVDLFGEKIRHSGAIELSTSGDIKRVEGGRALAPGAFLTMKITLPPKTRQGEIVLTHRPGGEGTACFITLTVGEKALLGRYSPPRTEALKVEAFDFSRFLDGEAAAPQTFTVVLFNNASAGSKEDYHLAGVQVFYKAMEGPKSKANVE